MIIDYASARALFEFVQARGFEGTSEEWASAMQREVAESAIRDFCCCATAVCLDGTLLPTFLAACAVARARFEHVHTSCNSQLAHISFTGRTAAPGAWLTQLTADIGSRNGVPYVRVQGYMRGRLRFSRTFVPTKAGEAA